VQVEQLRSHGSFLWVAGSTMVAPGITFLQFIRRRPRATRHHIERKNRDAWHGSSS
jgi:hypothetical protein